MKLLAWLKVSLKGIIKEFPAFVLSYAMYPLILALVMGYVQQDMFTPTINDPIFSVVIVDEDNTKESQGLVSFLNSEEISQVMTIVSDDNEKFDYTLRISKGYKDSLLGNSRATVKVEAEEKSSTTMGNVLVNIVDKYNMEISQGMLISKNIENTSLTPEEKDKLVEEVYTILTEVYDTDSIENNIYSVRKSLDSFEYFSVTFLSFGFIIFVMAIIASDAIEKENGLRNRIMSTSITRFQYFNYGLVSNYFTMIVINSLYIGVYRLSGLSFQGPLPLLMLIILIQSLLITTIGTLISTLFKKKYGLPLVQIFLIFQMILGGMIGPLDKWTGNPLFEFFSKYKPDILISNTWRNYILNGNLSSMSNYLLIMIGISLGLYLINLLAVSMKWGVKE